jgi:hypothetical protein
MNEIWVGRKQASHPLHSQTGFGAAQILWLDVNTLTHKLHVGGDGVFGVGRRVWVPRLCVQITANLLSTIFGANDVPMVAGAERNKHEEGSAKYNMSDVTS